MSYMNDDCDPFGVPYSNCDVLKKEMKKDSFKDLENLRKKEQEVSYELYKIREDKDKAICQLKEKLETYFEHSAKIECGKDMNWKIIIKKFDLSKLEQLKKDFDLRDIRIKCRKDKIEISLFT